MGPVGAHADTPERRLISVEHDDGGVDGVVGAGGCAGVDLVIRECVGVDRAALHAHLRGIVNEVGLRARLDAGAIDNVPVVPGLAGQHTLLGGVLGEH